MAKEFQTFTPTEDGSVGETPLATLESKETEVKYIVLRHSNFDTVMYSALFLMFLCLVVGVTILVVNFENLKNNIATTIVYDRAFKDGVSCGVDALTFYVNEQGMKEVDKSLVYKKALIMNGSR